MKRLIVGLPGLVWTKMVIDACGLNDILEPQQFLNDWEKSLNDIADEDGIAKMKGADDITRLIASKGIPMAIATSSRRESVMKKKKLHEDMFNRMNVIVCGDDVVNGKPAPDIFILAASRLGVSPENCVVFEDSLSGVIAGRRAGATVIAIPDPLLVLDLSPFYQETPHVLRDLTEWNIDASN